MGKKIKRRRSVLSEVTSILVSQGNVQLGTLEGINRNLNELRQHANVFRDQIQLIMTGLARLTDRASREIELENEIEQLKTELEQKQFKIELAQKKKGNKKIKGK